MDVTDAAPLIEYLELLQKKGQTHVSMDDVGRSILRQFYIRAKGGGQQPQAEVSVSVPSQATEQKQAVVHSSPAEPIPVIQSTYAGNSLAEKYTYIQQKYTSYGPVQQLTTVRKTPVFSQPAEAFDIMIVADSPQYHDEQNGIPFSGPAGQKLDGLLKAMGLVREQVHLTYVLKNRPAMPNQTTNNRSATTAELEVVKPLFDEEVSLFKPKVIISMGERAAQFLSGQPGDIDSIRGETYRYLGVPIVPTFKASFLLLHSDTKDKRAMWEDMLKVMEILQMPISERQRGFYAPK